MHLSPDSYNLLRGALEALGAPSSAGLPRAEAPTARSPFAWPRRVDVPEHEGWDRIEWLLPGCLQARVVRAGHMSQLDRVEPGRFEGTLALSGPSPAVLLLDGCRSVPPGCIEYETGTAGLEGRLRAGSAPHVFLYAHEAARVTISTGEPGVAATSEVALGAGELRRVRLSPAASREPITVRWDAIELARIDVRGGAAEPPTARFEVTPENLDFGKVDKLALTIRVHRSGRGAVDGVVHVGTTPHPQVREVHLASDDERFEHTFEVRANALPARPTGRLRVSFLSNSRLLDNRLQETHVTYTRPVLRRSLPRVHLPAGRRASVTLRCTHSAGARVELQPTLPDSLRELVDVHVTGSTLVFTARTRSRPASLEDVVRIVDVLSGLTTLVPVLLEGDPEVR